MKKFLFFVVFLIITEGILLAGEETVSLHLAFKNEKPNTYIVTDKMVGTIYVQNKPIVVTSDIEKARLIVDKTKQPEWLNSAANASGAVIQQPQTSIGLALNEQGNSKLSNATADNIGNRIAIFISDQLIMAPQIIEKIDSTEVLVTGSSFTEAEAQKIVDRINGN